MTKLSGPKIPFCPPSGPEAPKNRSAFHPVGGDLGFVLVNGWNSIRIPRPLIGRDFPLLCRFLDLADEFLMVVERERPRQFLSAKGTLYRFIGYFHHNGINIGPEQCTDDHLYLFRSALRAWINPRKGRKLQQNTLANNFAVISSFFRYLSQTKSLKHVVANPGALEKKVRDLEARSLPKDTLQRLFNKLGRGPEGQEKRLLCETLYATACRFGEIVGLLRSAIAFGGPADLATITLRERKGGKTRDVYLPVSLKDRIAQHMATWPTDGVNGPVFPSLSKTGFRSPGFLGKDIARILRGFGIQRDIYGTHIFRHSAAQHLLDAGAPFRLVSDLLSHSDNRTTRTYCDHQDRVIFEAYRTYVQDFDLTPFQLALEMGG